MTNNIYWTIDATVKEGRLADLKEHFKLMIEMTSREAGALSYDFWLSDDETRVFIHERYADNEAALAHVQNVGAHLGPFLDAIEMAPLVLLGPVNDAVKAVFDGFGASYTTFLGGLPT
ncbi:MAG: putative quinol monooxygenase [Myxococcota bacterium]